MLPAVLLVRRLRLADTYETNPQIYATKRRIVVTALF